MPSSLITELNEKNFDSETFDSEGPVLVYFGAEQRCGICMKLVPLLEELAEEYAGKLKVRKVNVDQCPSLATRFRLRGIPALFLFKDGLVEEQLGGFHEKAALVSVLDKHLR
ncbi:MAG: conjugal transfer protein TraF [Deltaproteobacteria bacterium]|nr:conjugal transfer protein TraF [Deltaproteobacteria bacterium]MBW2086872.1 conjugal transfer protein TraF [Deltaproteobacteria bacterium]